MNIFYVDKNPVTAAKMMCDKHIIKMILESAQMLCTAKRVLDGKEYFDTTKNGRKIKRWRLDDPDEEAIIYLSELRQIGRWSAEMILLFTYNRSNIWPIQDIGLLRAISKNYKKKYLPPHAYVNFLQKKFSPYCSVATWYLWRSIDDEPIQY